MLTMLLLKAGESTTVVDRPKSPVLNPIRAIKATMGRQAQVSYENSRQDMSRSFHQTPPLFGSVGPSPMLSASKLPSTQPILGVQGTSRFMSGRDRA
jgi:hypothetical protein